MNIKQRLAFCSSAAAMMSIANIAEAQSITGQVTDSTGEAPLQGAIVSIEGLNRSVSTDRYGDYRITNVPSGTYSIIVDYVGAETVSNLITVPETGTTCLLYTSPSPRDS